MRDVIRLAFLGILGAGLVLPQVISAQTAKPRSSAANAGGALVNGDWAYVGHDAGGMRYSPLKQINVDNVKNLRVAWTYHVGDISDGKGFARRSGFENTPILVDGTLYLTTPFNRVIALNPETGTQLWAYDPKIDQKWQAGDGLINRGVATWVDTGRVAGKPCHRGIFEATIDARLIAVDAATGLACADFGGTGEISL